ncbi:MAG: VPLPA-CTERM sorting domain-containing protein, partial [Pseudomonadota bacterium]
FGFDTSGLDPQVAFSVATTEPVATFFLNAPLTNAGGTLTASFGFGPPLFSPQYSGEVTLIGTPTAVPLPAGGLLLLGGLLGLGALRRRPRAGA